MLTISDNVNSLKEVIKHFTIALNYYICGCNNGECDNNIGIGGVRI